MKPMKPMNMMLSTPRDSATLEAAPAITGATTRRMKTPYQAPQLTPLPVTFGTAGKNVYTTNESNGIFHAFGPS